MRNPNRWTSDYPQLIEAVLARATRPNSPDHGVHHWQLVAWTAAQLVPEVSGVDPDVVFTFALFHDSMRLNEFTDPEHGKRGGELAAEMLGGWPYLSRAQLDDIVFACTEHTSGETTSDPSIGVCWDSDRLNLWRVGYEPDGAYLSTEPARRRERIEWAYLLQEEDYSWEQVCAAYSALT